MHILNESELLRQHRDELVRGLGHERLIRQRRGKAFKKTLAENPIMPAVLQACDVGVIRSTRSSAPCRPSSRPWVIAAASLGSGMAFLDSTVLNVALPAVQAKLELSARQVQWVFGAFALVLAAFLLVGGSFGDRYGRRLVFVLGAAMFAASSVWRPPAP